MVRQFAPLVPLVRAVSLAAAALTAIGLGSPELAPAATAPSAVAPGPNGGSADSLVGPHVWYFNASPGTFTVTVDATGTSQDSVPVGGAFAVRVAFSPAFAGDRFTSQPTATGLIVHGNVARAAKVLITIVPPNSPLVRVARNYTIAVTGDVAFAATGDPIVGVYLAKRNSYGATRFSANGTIVTSDGQQGRWVVFDASMRLYTVTIGADRMSLKLVGGRGLVDPNDTVTFELAH